MAAPFDIAHFNELLITRSFGRTLIFEPSTGSTMDMAREAARRGAVEGTVALADEQTAGRGRMGRSWITPPALNVTSTLVLRPPPAVLRQVAMMAPLAIVNGIASGIGMDSSIKWPNDVMMSEKKVAGILIEIDTAGEQPLVLVGAGINANFDPSQHDEIRDIATSLYLELGREVEREGLLAVYLLEFEKLYDRALAGENIRDLWRRMLDTLGQPVKVTHPAGVTEGIAEDVDDEGGLVVRTASGDLVTVEAGDVSLRT